MNRTLVDKIAQALLYEGYTLYPYRPSVKSRQRWMFGGLYPRHWSETQESGDAWTMQTEVLIQGPSAASVEVTARFLHLIDRTVGKLPVPIDDLPAQSVVEFQTVESLRVGPKTYQAWQEATERRVEAGEFKMEELIRQPRQIPFSFPFSREIEPLRNRDRLASAPSPGTPGEGRGEGSAGWDSLSGAPARQNPLPEYREREQDSHPARAGTSSGNIVGLLIRQQQAVEGIIEVSCETVAEDLHRVRVKIINQTDLPNAAAISRDDALVRSLLSMHTILGVRDGDFLSLTDPPEQLQSYAASCKNIGTWPVLIGSGTEHDTMLSSPIIVSDYPQLAPESPGDLFDSTEIDEILTLRIMTLTDEEKQQAADVDERVRNLLRRTESLARDQLMSLHGTVRGLVPVSSIEPRPAAQEQSHG